MDHLSECSFPLSKGRACFLLAHYFIGYQFLYPNIFADLTLRMDPGAKMIHPWFQMGIYIWMIAVTITVAWPLLKESMQTFLRDPLSIIKTCLKMLVLFYVVNIIVNLIVLMFSSTNESANQTQVIEAMQVFPAITLFSSLIYAPIVEEILFRGICYRALRPKFRFIAAALFSAFIFGFIHVMDSVFIGNFNDLIYLLSYGCIGFFLALTYEKTNSIYGSMFLHFLNNAIAFLLLIV